MSRSIRWYQHLKWLAEAVVAAPMLALGAIWPQSLLAGLGQVGGYLIYHLFAAPRRWALLNLQIAFPDRNRREWGRLAMAAFAHQVVLYCEILRMTPRWIDRHLEIEGASHIPANGRPLIIVAGHVGNFDLYSPALACIGRPNCIVARPLDNPYLRWVLDLCRRRYGTRATGKDLVGIRTAMRLLQQGGAIVIGIDLNTIRHPVFVDFFGVSAASPRGAAEMALLNHATVVLATARRQTNGRHRVVFHPPFELIRTGRHENDVAANLQQFTHALERYLRQWPEQYFWQHPRFRLRPDGSTWTSRTSWLAVQDQLQAPEGIGQQNGRDAADAVRVLGV